MKELRFFVVRCRFSSVSTQRHAVNLLFLIIHAMIYNLHDLVCVYSDLTFGSWLLPILHEKLHFSSIKLTVLRVKVLPGYGSSLGRGSGLSKGPRKVFVGLA